MKFNCQFRYSFFFYLSAAIPQLNVLVRYHVSNASLKRTFPLRVTADVLTYYPSIFSLGSLTMLFSFLFIFRIASDFNIMKTDTLVNACWVVLVLS